MPFHLGKTLDRITVALFLTLTAVPLLAVAGGGAIH